MWHLFSNMAANHHPLACFFTLILTFSRCSLLKYGQYWRYSHISNVIKKCRWNSDCTSYLLQDDTNMMMIQHTIFRPIVNEVQSCLSMMFNGEIKGQSSLSQPCAKKARDMKKFRLPPCRAQGEDCEDVHIVQIRCLSFRPIYFEPHTTSMEPALLVAAVCRCDSHLLCRLNVRVLRINITLLCKHWVSSVLFWAIFPDIYIIQRKCSAWFSPVSWN